MYHKIKVRRSIQILLQRVTLLLYPLCFFRVKVYKTVDKSLAMDDYESLLKKAEAELPEQTESGERFTIEKIKGHLEGNKTVLINLKAIAKSLGREEAHLLKYLLRELATPGKSGGGRIILGTKVPASKINKKIQKYASEFVYCSECGKPETQLLSEKGISHLKCLACGIKKPVKSI